MWELLAILNEKSLRARKAGDHSEGLTLRKEKQKGKETNALLFIAGVRRPSAGLRLVITGFVN